MRCEINTVIIESKETWPDEVIAFLDNNIKAFWGWECSCCPYDKNYDDLIYEFRSILKKYNLIGYHCTKLTRREITEVFNKGMTLQNLDSLKNRIDLLKKQNFINKDIAEKLTSTNQADHKYRANMLWFCFFQPYLAGQSGIERFFRSWGGEALYNSHEGTPDTGEKLLKIGIPCIIKAIVPMSVLQDSYLPDGPIIRAYLKDKGHELSNSIEHEGFSRQSIPPENILEIAEYPSASFSALTKCDEWEPLLVLPEL